jgi:hypothetical protein
MEETRSLGELTNFLAFYEQIPPPSVSLLIEIFPHKKTFRNLH